jgi:hypothetical protein
MSQIPGLEESLDRINKLAAAHDVQSTSASYRSFLDEMGRETFFLQNISDFDLYFGDQVGVLKRGAVRDLLEDTDLQTLNSNRNIRTIMNSNPPAVKRLTKEEFLRCKSDYEEMERKTQKKREEIQRGDLSGESKAQPRLHVTARIEDLKRFYMPGSDPSLVLSPDEFMKWAATERFEKS